MAQAVLNKPKGDLLEPLGGCDGEPRDKTSPPLLDVPDEGEILAIFGVEPVKEAVLEELEGGGVGAHRAKQRERAGPAVMCCRALLVSLERWLPLVCRVCAQR